MPFVDEAAARAGMRATRDVALEWDAAAGRVAVSVRIGSVGESRERSAAAISSANAELKLVGFRLRGDELVFSMTAFLEPDGRVSSAVLQRLVVIARVAVRSFGARLEAAPGGPKKRRLSPEVSRRVVEVDDALRGDLVAAVLRDLPALAPLVMRAAEATEVVQDFFPRHRIIELAPAAEMVLHVAVPQAGEARLLTTRLDELNAIAAVELAGADLEDDAACAAYLSHASDWARRTPRERRLESLEGDARVAPPRSQMNVNGHQLVFWVLAGNEPVRRTAVLHVFDGHLELSDE